jgi:hypothetical protein
LSNCRDRDQGSSKGRGRVAPIGSILRIFPKIARSCRDLTFKVSLVSRSLRSLRKDKRGQAKPVGVPIMLSFPIDVGEVLLSGIKVVQKKAFTRGWVGIDRPLRDRQVWESVGIEGVFRKVEP